MKEAAKRGIPLSSASGIGHGVGRGEIEGPYLAADDPTVLCENMVIALDVATLGRKGNSSAPSTSMPWKRMGRAS